MPDSLQDLESRRADLVKQIADLGDLRGGSISDTSGRCGKPNCRCHKPGNPVHGPNPRLTYKDQGKTVTGSLPTPAARKKAEREIAEFRHFEQVIRMFLDVYSLGTILYELLAGAPPIELRKVALDEFLRRLREDDPVKPSTKIRTLEPATSTDVARKRQIEPPALAKLMRGDLDSIALKALEKDRARRYGSPSDFAADINRYLKNEAVLAVPPSAGYRAGKFARRGDAPDHNLSTA